MSHMHVTDSQVKFVQFGDVLVHFENWMASHWCCVGSVGYVRNSLFVASNICWKMVLDLTLVVEGGEALSLMAHKMLSCNILNCLCLQHEIVHFKQDLFGTGFMTVKGM